MLEQTSIKLTYWGKFKRLPKFTREEKLICQFEGTEEYRLLAFQNALKFSQRHQCSRGLNGLRDCMFVDEPLFDMFSGIEQENSSLEPVVQRVVLKKGDCLFVPAFSWIQSRSLPEHELDVYPRTGFVSVNFRAHSVLASQIVGLFETNMK